MTVDLDSQPTATPSPHGLDEDGFTEVHARIADRAKRHDRTGSSPTNPWRSCTPSARRR